MGNNTIYSFISATFKDKDQLDYILDANWYRKSTFQPSILNRRVKELDTNKAKRRKPTIFKVFYPKEGATM